MAVAAVGLLVAGCGGVHSRLASHMQRGEGYFDHGDYAKASIEFRNAIQIDPRDANARVMAGRAAEQLGLVREALGLYQSAVDAAPENAAARANLGRVFTFAGAPDRALKVVDEGLTKHPDDPDLLTVRAAARAQMKNEPGAIADADRALQLAPLNQDAIALRAALYKQAGDALHAEALLTDAVGRLPKATGPREVLANLYVETNSPGKAEGQLRKLVELKPLELSYRLQLALFYARAHRLDDAQQVLEAAVKAMPQRDDAKLALVDFVTSQRTREQGEKTLRKFIDDEPGDLELRLGLGALLERYGATTEAVQTYNEVIRRDGTNRAGLAARDRIATMAVGQGHYEEAEKAIAEVLDKSPRDNDALSLRGVIELERNDPVAAIADLRSVLRDQPGSVGVQRALARAYEVNTEPALAEQALKAAMDVAPTDTTVRIELAQLLAQSDRADQAVALLEETVRRAPNDPPAREALVRAYIAKGDYAAAKVAVDNLVILRPEAAMGPYLSGLIAQAQMRLDDSQKDFERALQIQPKAMDAIAALARLRVSRGQAAAALTSVRVMLDADPRNPPLHNLLGELLITTKAYPEAIAELTRATQLAPKWWVPYRNLAAARVATRDIPGATAACEAGVKAVPFQPDLIGDLAALYERQARVYDAIALYEGLYTHNPRLEKVANNLALLLVTYRTDQHSLDRARDMTAAFGTSNNGVFLDTHGWVRLKEGDLTAALASLERAAEKAPDSSMIRYHLAMAQLRAGQKAKARANLEAALSGAGVFAGSTEARAVLASLSSGSG